MNTKEIREAAEAAIKAEASADVLRSVGAESNMYAPWRPPVCIAMEAQKVLALCDAADGNERLRAIVEHVYAEMAKFALPEMAADDAAFDRVEGLRKQAKALAPNTPEADDE